MAEWVAIVISIIALAFAMWSWVKADRAANTPNWRAHRLDETLHWLTNGNKYTAKNVAVLTGFNRIVKYGDVPPGSGVSIRFNKPDDIGPIVVLWDRPGKRGRKEEQTLVSN